MESNHRDLLQFNFVCNNQQNTLDYIIRVKFDIEMEEVCILLAHNLVMKYKISYT